MLTHITFICNSWSSRTGWACQPRVNIAPNLMRNQFVRRTNEKTKSFACNSKEGEIKSEWGSAWASLRRSWDPNEMASAPDYLSKSNIAIKKLALGRGYLRTSLWGLSRPCSSGRADQTSTWQKYGTNLRTSWEGVEIGTHRVCKPLAALLREKS